MKKIILILSVIAFFYNNSFAQCDEQCKKKEQIKAQKVSFITEKLQLTVEEAQQFWPIYNEKNKKSEEIDKEEKSIMQNYKKNKETLSNKDIEALSDKLIELEVASSKLDADYYVKFKKVLPITKIMELNHAERQFKHELLKQLKGCSPTKE
ncbi:MAG: hypothetical protein HY951_14000 [Bacteroidia bacterium]|nr:hypothetical protein [Bacteroidia bacterium]